MAYKEGIALGLVEVLENAHHKLLDEWEKALTLSIYCGVCDERCACATQWERFVLENFEKSFAGCV